MNDEHPHPLLAQLPLTVSPFLSLPAATTLPYTYRQLPSSLPPSSTLPATQAPSSALQPSSSPTPEAAPPPKVPYVLSATGAFSAHPDDIIASCRALQAHLQTLTDDARAVVRKWEQSIKERDLAEKRRVAPGWLDVGEQERMLVPERKGGLGTDLMAGVEMQEPSRSREAEELDRAFGGLRV